MSIIRLLVNVLKNAGYAIGKSSIVSLPNNYKEILVLSSAVYQSHYGQTVIFPNMGGTGTIGQSLSWTDGKYVSILVDFANNKVTLYDAADATNCRMEVYYR